MKDETVTACFLWYEELNTYAPSPSLVMLRMYLKITYLVKCNQSESNSHRTIAKNKMRNKVEIQREENIFI